MSKKIKKAVTKADTSVETEEEETETKATKASRSVTTYEVYNGLGKLVKEFDNKEEAEAYAELYRFEVR